MVAGLLRRRVRVGAEAGTQVRRKPQVRVDRVDGRLTRLESRLNMSITIARTPEYYGDQPCLDRIGVEVGLSLCALSFEFLKFGLAEFLECLRVEERLAVPL